MRELNMSYVGFLLSLDVVQKRLAQLRDQLLFHLIALCFGNGSYENVVAAVMHRSSHCIPSSTPIPGSHTLRRFAHTKGVFLLVRLDVDTRDMVECLPSIQEFAERSPSENYVAHFDQSIEYASLCLRCLYVPINCG